MLVEHGVTHSLPISVEAIEAGVEAGIEADIEAASRLHRGCIEVERRGVEARAQVANMSRCVAEMSGRVNGVSSHVNAPTCLVILARLGGN